MMMFGAQCAIDSDRLKDFGQEPEPVPAPIEAAPVEVAPVEPRASILASAFHKKDYSAIGRPAMAAAWTAADAAAAALGRPETAAAADGRPETAAETAGQKDSGPQAPPL